MRDPHVVALRYRLDPHETVTFDSPPPVECETDSFSLRLDNGVATLKFKEHFSSVEAARRIAEDFLRAWEIDVGLSLGRREIAFTFQDFDLVDRNPPPSGSSQGSELRSLGIKGIAAKLTLHVKRRTYPEPPRYFRLSPDVETLWHRFEGYTDDREPLLSMGYFCLTLVEARAGGREEAAKRYRIHRQVLRKLGELSSQRGDEKTARKFKRGSPLAPLTQQEKRWVEAAIKLVIRRVGEIDSDAGLPEITMGDLPTL